jgi:tetratricopeptide (TPR) repeat protein
MEQIKDPKLLKELKVKKFVTLGDEQIARGNYQDAVSLYKEALRFDQSNAEALYSIASVFTIDPYIDYPKALEIAQKAIESDPSHIGKHVIDNKY